MQNIRHRKIYDAKSRSAKRSSGKLIQKISFLTLLFVSGIFLLNSKQIAFFSDISELGKGLLGKKVLITNLEAIKDDQASWPLKEVTNWGTIKDYEKTKYTQFESLSEDDKTQFPIKLSNIIEKYKYVSSANIWANITNPYERQQVLLYKRLVTTTWMSDYNTPWITESGLHGGDDFVSSIGTPIYAITNGIVLKTCTQSCDDLGNHVAIGTNFKGNIIAVFYAHMQAVKNGLKEGDLIKRGDLIGYIGSTGNSTAPHLHLQINKIGSADNIKNIDYSTEMYSSFTSANQNLSILEEKTLNPISFIESNLNGGTNDSFTPSLALGNTESSPEISQIIEQDTGVQQTGDETTKKEIIKDFKISNIEINKLENKLTLGDSIKVTITTSGSNGAIAVTTNNDVLSPSANSINPNGANKYEIIVTAKSVGNGQIIFDDGSDKKIYYYSVYDKASEVYGIQIESPDTLFTSKASEVIIYPIDKLMNKVNASLQGDIKVIFEDKISGEQKTVLDIQNDEKLSTFLKLNVQAPALRDYTMKVIYEGNGNTLTASKPVSTDIFLDYSINSQYGSSIKSLNEKGIVKGHDGLMYPENTISRGEIITILMRNKYGDDFDGFNTEMKQYIKTKGKFFKDVKGDEWYAPYLFKAFQDGTLKGDKGRALADNAISKAEIITIYGRYFGVQENEIFTTWIDVNDNDWFKPFADASKKYNLFPFDDLSYFNADAKVKRVNAFESLYRYINFKPENIVSATPSISNESTSNDGTNISNNSNTSSNSSGSAQSIDTNGSTDSDKNNELEGIMKNLLF